MSRTELAVDFAEGLRMADDSDQNALARLLQEHYGDPRTQYRNPLMELAKEDVQRNPWALPPPPRPYSGEIKNLPPRPTDAMAPVSEALSPTMGAYGAGETLADILSKTYGGDYKGAADKLPMALGIFAGVRAKTAPMLSLAKAQEMAAKGTERAAIWNDTGWFQGRDGKWRFEINDRGAEVPTKTGAGPASEMLPHPEFSAAYPHLDKLHTVLDTDGWVGGNFGRHPVFGDTIVIGEPNPVAARKLGLHERQHAVQKEEGFERGANPQSFKSDPDTLRKIITGQLDDMLPEKSIFADYLTTAAQLEVPGFKGATLGELKQHILAQQLLGRLPADMSGIAKKLSDTIARNRYRLTAGEVEARNVERRSRMSDEQRRTKPPWETQDVPDIHQILRGYDGK